MLFTQILHKKQTQKNKGETFNLTGQCPERHSSPGHQLAQRRGHQASGQEELRAEEGAMAARPVQGRKGHGSTAACGGCTPVPVSTRHVSSAHVHTHVCLCGSLQPEGSSVADSLASAPPHRDPGPLHVPHAQSLPPYLPLWSRVDPGAASFSPATPASTLCSACGLPLCPGGPHPL